MANNFQTVGWEDWEGNPHSGVPGDKDNPDVDVSDVQGLFTRVEDEETGEVRYIWTYVEYDPDHPMTWVQWDDLIEDILIEEYGLEMV